MPRTSPISTRTSLQIAAFAALQAVFIIGLAPLTPSVAAWFPPAYALVAGVQTLFIFTARRYTGVAWAGTLTAALTAVLSGPFTAIGWLLAVPLVAAGCLFDLVAAYAGRRGIGVRRDSILAGIVIGVTLFVVSLPVMNAEKLTVGLLVATLAARVIASWGGAILSARLIVLLRRAGVSRGADSRQPTH